MKNIFLLFFLLVCTKNLIGQTSTQNQIVPLFAGGYNIEQLPGPYLHFSLRPVSPTSLVNYVYTHGYKSKESFDTYLRNKNGDPIQYKEVSTILNLFHQRGWKLQTTYIQNDLQNFVLIK